MILGKNPCHVTVFSHNGERVLIFSFWICFVMTKLSLNILGKNTMGGDVFLFYHIILSYQGTHNLNLIIIGDTEFVHFGLS